MLCEFEGSEDLGFDTRLILTHEASQATALPLQVQLVRVVLATTGGQDGNPVHTSVSPGLMEQEPVRRQAIVLHEGSSTTAQGIQLASGQASP
jgi:hypothetical protein